MTSLRFPSNNQLNIFSIKSQLNEIYLQLPELKARFIIPVSWVLSCWCFVLKHNIQIVFLRIEDDYKSQWMWTPEPMTSTVDERLHFFPQDSQMHTLNTFNHRSDSVMAATTWRTSSSYLILSGVTETLSECCDGPVRCWNGSCRFRFAKLLMSAEQKESGNSESDSESGSHWMAFLYWRL